MGDHTLLSPNDTAADLDGTAFTHGSGHLEGGYATDGFVGAVRMVDAVAVVAEELNHHPDVVLGWGRIGFRLSSHDAGGVTARDVALARRIQEIADEQGVTVA